MRIDEEYRGHLIRYRRKRGWIANIWPRFGLFPLATVPFASDEEGKDILRQRVRDVVDEQIASGAYAESLLDEGNF